MSIHHFLLSEPKTLKKEGEEREGRKKDAATLVSSLQIVILSPKKKWGKRKEENLGMLSRKWDTNWSQLRIWVWWVAARKRLKWTFCGAAAKWTTFCGGVGERRGRKSWKNRSSSAFCYFVKVRIEFFSLFFMNGWFFWSVKCHLLKSFKRSPVFFLLFLMPSWSSFFSSQISSIILTSWKILISWPEKTFLGMKSL